MGNELHAGVAFLLKVEKRGKVYKYDPARTQIPLNYLVVFSLRG